MHPQFFLIIDAFSMEPDHLCLLSIFFPTLCLKMKILDNSRQLRCFTGYRGGGCGFTDNSRQKLIYTTRCLSCWRGTVHVLVRSVILLSLNRNPARTSESWSSSTHESFHYWFAFAALVYVNDPVHSWATRSVVAKDYVKVAPWFNS